jgi:hypothetical protein
MSLDPRDQAMADEIRAYAYSLNLAITKAARQQIVVDLDIVHTLSYGQPPEPSVTVVSISKIIP